MVRLISVKKYEASDGTQFDTYEEAIDHERLRALEDFFTSLGVYGVGSGYSEHQVDLTLLCDKVVKMKDQLIAILGETK